MKTTFNAYRGFVMFPNQQSIFNMNLSDNSNSKNKLLNDVISDLCEKKKLESLYQKRIYYFILKNDYDDIVHCQLARKREYNKHDLIENNIVESEETDFPYINVLFDKKSQKFLIETNSQVFENSETCAKVLKNIIDSNKIFKDNDVFLELNTITESSDFWEYFSQGIIVSKVNFKLEAPNLFDAEDDASDFMKEAKKNIGASEVNLEFSNKKFGLVPNKQGIDSYINYISSGGGKWALTYKDENGKNKNVNSGEKSIKIESEIEYEDFKNATLTDVQLSIIRETMDRIETIERLKS